MVRAGSGRLGSGGESRSASVRSSIGPLVHEVLAVCAIRMPQRDCRGGRAAAWMSACVPRETGRSVLETMSNSSEARPPIRFRGRSFMATVLAPVPPSRICSPISTPCAAGARIFRRPPDDPRSHRPVAEAGGPRRVDRRTDGPFDPGARHRGRPAGHARPRPAAAPLGRTVRGRGRHTGCPRARADVEDGAGPLADPRCAGPFRPDHLHLEGDVTVLGAVASGSEVIAGGSIHVYGALRGRGGGGASGNPSARIWCRRLRAGNSWPSTASTRRPTISTRRSTAKPVEVRLVDDSLKLTLFDQSR